MQRTFFKKLFQKNHVLMAVLTVIISGFSNVHAQYEVVLVKENVKLNGQTVAVGQKLQQTDLDRLHFEGNNAMIAVYSPSQGRIVRPEKEEIIAQAAATGAGIKRNAELDAVAERLRDYFKSYVILTDHPQIKINTAELLKDDDSPLYKGQYKNAVVYTRYQDQNTTTTNGKAIFRLDTLSESETVYLAKNKLYHSEPANEHFKTDIYVKIAGGTTSDSTLVKTVYLTYFHPNQAQELIKEVQTIKRANDASGKSELETFNLVYKFLDKYYGTPLPSDLGLWLNKNLMMTLNTDQLVAPADQK